jgi:hypothetical protein
VPVTIATGGGTSPVDGAAMFTYYPAPEVTDLSPNHGPAEGGTTVVVRGSHLASVLAVTVGGTAATVLSATDDAITMVTPPGAPGAVWVSVETKGGVAVADPAQTFTYD